MVYIKDVCILVGNFRDNVYLYIFTLFYKFTKNAALELIGLSCLDTYKEKVYFARAKI